MDKNGDIKYVTISRTQLVNTETGEVKVLAASNFHAEEEKKQFLVISLELNFKKSLNYLSLSASLISPSLSLSFTFIAIIVPIYT
jgi:hypothetical protein